MSSMWDQMKKMASKGFDEAADTMRMKQDPIEAAQKVKKYAEELERENKKKGR